MQQVFDWILAHWAFCAFALACFIQITPVVRCNPLTALFAWAGKLITTDVMREISCVKAAQKELECAIDENEKDRIRFEVLDFASSCRNGQLHTKDEFEHIIVLNKKYHRLLNKTGDENGVFDAEYEYIYELYQKCQRENDFL